MDPVANAVAIITGTVQLGQAIYECIEAIEDAPQQVRHLQDICAVVNTKLTQIRRTLQESRHILNQDGDHTIYYSSICRVVESMETDLRDIQEQIPQALTSKKWIDKIFPNRIRPLTQALELKLNMNKMALERIDRSMTILNWTTMDLWKLEMVPRRQFDQPSYPGFINELRQLIKDLAATEMDHSINVPSDRESPPPTPLTLEQDGNSQQTEPQSIRWEISTLKSCALSRAKHVAVKSLGSSTHTPTQMPSPCSGLMPMFPSVETLVQDEGHITLKELQFRKEEALRMVEQAQAQELPDVAAEMHSQAMDYQAQVAEKEGSPCGFEGRASMEMQHISILLSCFELSKKDEGLSRLKELAREIDDLALSADVENEMLYQTYRSIGRQYYELRHLKTAVHYLRHALFDGNLMQTHHQHKEEIKDLVQIIADAYRKDGDPVREAGFTSMVRESLGYDPLANVSEVQAVLDFCREWNFDVGAEAGSSPSFGQIRDGDGHCPLHKAVLNPGTNIRVVRQLSVDHDALDAKGNDGLTPLFMAVENGNIEVVRILLDEGASLDARKPPADLSDTLLHCCEDPEIMKLLLENMTRRRQRRNSEQSSVESIVNIDTQSLDSATPLLSACDRGNYEIARLLLDYGANVNLCNSNDQTPLIVACYNKKYSSASKTRMSRFVTLLVGKGAMIDAMDNDGRTARLGLKLKKFSKKEIDSLLLSPARTESLDSGVGTLASSRSGSSD